VAATGGIRFGNFTLFRRLARGGMAEVFLARQIGLEGFDRRVAVKRILPHLADSKEFTEMFLREAKLAARLSHPNIVHIYDFGKVGTDYFIAMEFVDGVTAGELIARCAKEPMPAVLVARLGADAAAALHYAHELRNEAGKPLRLVHRDVSPANVMVSFDGVIKVVDFGIAKAAELHDDRTNPGTVKGKYAYMSPEQTIAAQLDGRSDVFSLSIVMWELVAARPIVERGDRVAAMRAIRDGRLPRLDQVAPQTPRALIEAINWGLSRRREDRPDAAQLAQELEAFIKASPELATAMHLSAWLRPRFQSSVEVAENAHGDGTAAGQTAQDHPSTQAVYSEEDLAATIPVERMSAAEIFGSHRGAAPTYYPPMRTTPAPGSPGSVPASLNTPNPASSAAPTAGASGGGAKPGASGGSAKPGASANRPQSHPAQATSPAPAVARSAAGAGPNEAQAQASNRQVARAAAPDASAMMDTEAVTALPPPRRGKGRPAEMPSPAPLATPQRTFSDAEQDEYAAITRRRLWMAVAAVALIVTAFLFTLFVVQPILARRSATAKQRPVMTSSPMVNPITEPADPQATSRLSVRTSPASEIFLDERSLGQSPVGEIDVPAGAHTLSFQRPGAEAVTRKVTLKPGEKIELNVDLP
jgi:eukaryotic-like serine/threonine-protein kinase